MKRLRNIVSILLVAAMASIGVSAQTQRRPYRNNDYQTRQIIQRIETRTETFRNNLSNALNNNRVGGTRAQSNIEQFVNDFSDAVRILHDHLDRRTANNADVQTVLTRASSIDNFMARRSLGTQAESDWTALRSDLSELASAYNINWQPNSSSNQTNYPPSNRGGGYNNRNLLTGTYRLDTSRSDDARNAAQRAVRNLPYNQRQQVLDQLTARLESPDQIAINKRGRSVTIASSRSPQITFEADGQDRVEQSASGRSIRARATLNGDQLTISSTGDRGNDFSATIEPIDNGQRLSVRRTIYTTNLTTPVVVQSTYDRTSDVAQLDIFNGPTNNPTDGNVTTASGDFIVPNNTSIIATLNDNLSTATARENDRFTMTVREPGQYQGATIEGHITGIQRSGRVTGRSGMTLNFDTIRLQNGSSYRFAGLVENARTANGENVRVDTE
ncbi:MAG: hypothetical protein WBP93_03665, partial [Pyrinomonadaceae bacterium]